MPYINIMKNNVKNGTNGPLYAVLKSRLEDKILSGNLTDGDFFCTIKSLCTEYDVSLITARKTVELMVDEGIITCRSSRGIFIQDRRKLLSLSSLRNHVAIIHNHPLNGLSTYFSLRLWSMSQTLAERGIGIKVFRYKEKEDFDKLFTPESFKAVASSQPVFNENEISYYASQVPLLFFVEKECRKNIITVTPNFDEMAETIFNFLIKQKPKKIIVVGTNSERICSYLDSYGIENEGIEMKSAAVNGLKVGRTLLKLPENTAIIASDEYVSLGIVEAFLKAGRDIRESGRFISIGNPYFSLASELRIPTIGCDPCKVGSIAGKALADAIRPPFKTDGVIKVKPEIYLPNL